MDKLKELISLCKASVTIKVNDHKDDYASVEDYMKEQTAEDELSDEVLAKMIETDTIVNIHFYPDTPIGFYVVYHYDLDSAIDEAIKVLKEDRLEKK